MFTEKSEWVLILLGVSEEGGPKYEALKFLGIGMGGILVALQALMAYKRAKAMEDTAKAQADAANTQARATEEQAKANLHTEQGQRQERLKNAIEHLGHEAVSVRLGGAYELFHLAQDTEKLCQTVLEILCAHIRQTTSESKYREAHKSNPSEEIQSLLTLLFVEGYEVFIDLRRNLQGSWLNGADLFQADLRWANLSQAHLQKASFYGAYLHEASLSDAQMQEAELAATHLDNAFLQGAKLQGANLGGSCLRGADLIGAQLQGVNLANAQMQGAILGSVQLQGAYLANAQMQGVTCDEDISTSFAQRMRESVDHESDLSWVFFTGGLSQKDMDALVEGLSDKKTRELQEKLKPHIDISVSSELPEESDAVIGVYTKEDAEKWIAEYETALSEPLLESPRHSPVGCVVCGAEIKTSWIAELKPAASNPSCSHGH